MQMQINAAQPAMMPMATEDSVLDELECPDLLLPSRGGDAGASVPNLAEVEFDSKLVALDDSFMAAAKLASMLETPLVSASSMFVVHSASQHITKTEDTSDKPTCNSEHNLMPSHPNASCARHSLHPAQPQPRSVPSLATPPIPAHTPTTCPRRDRHLAGSALAWATPSTAKASPSIKVPFS